MIDYIFLNSVNKHNTNLENYIQNTKDNKSYFKKFNNINVYIDENIINISGSIQKYGIGNNYEDCSYNDCLEYLNCLDAEIDIDISNFNVYQYEIGANFKTEVAPPLYINSLITPTLFKESPYKNKKGLTGKVFGIGANHKNKNDYLQIVMYDKTSEVKFNKELLKPEYVDVNLLRCEVKRPHLIQTKLKLKESLKVKDLFENKTKKLILSDAKKNLDRIQIDDYYKIPEFKNYSDIRKIMFLMNTPKLNKWLASLEIYFKEYNVSPNEKSRIRKLFRERGKGFEIENNSLGAELREKINDKFSKELSETI